MGLLAAILVAWLLAGGSFLGIGLLISRFDWPEPKQASDYFDAFWLGFAAIVALLQVWHLFFAINAWLVLVAVALGAIGLLARGGAWSPIGCASSRRVVLVAGAFVLGAVWLA